ncbi:substrate-binding periplasmic protein [Chromobacterium sp. CV08]|uniref:substrate-binding periplasmic protein n=1 Tax=Chromobacterium sp. CV08 TaxID=3133274 RepID=UPI003DA89CB3
MRSVWWAWALSLAALPAWPAVKCPPHAIRLAFYPIGQFYRDRSGLDWDVAEELRRRSGCRFEYVVMPRARIWKELEAGRLDITLSAIATPERENVYWFLNYIQLKQYVLLSPSLPAGIASMEDFLDAGPQWRWTIVRSYSTSAYYDPLIARLAAQGRVVEVTEEDVLFRMLVQNRAVGMFSTPMVYRAKLREFGLEDKVRVVDWDRQSAPSPRGIVFTKRTFAEADIGPWREMVDGMNRDGTMRRLIGRYMSPSETATALWR